MKRQITTFFEDQIKNLRGAFDGTNKNKAKEPTGFPSEPASSYHSFSAALAALNRDKEHYEKQQLKKIQEKAYKEGSVPFYIAHGVAGFCGFSMMFLGTSQLKPLVRIPLILQTTALTTFLGRLTYSALVPGIAVPQELPKAEANRIDEKYHWERYTRQQYFKAKEEGASQGKEASGLAR